MDKALLESNPAGLFLCDNIIKEDVGDRRYTSPPHVSHGLLFCKKGRVFLNAYERLVAAGFTATNAAETCMWYMAQGDDEGLEGYVQSCESYMERKPQEVTV